LRKSKLSNDSEDTVVTIEAGNQSAGNQPQDNKSTVEIKIQVISIFSSQIYCGVIWDFEICAYTDFKVI